MKKKKSDTISRPGKMKTELGKKDITYDIYQNGFSGISLGIDRTVLGHYGRHEGRRRRKAK